eukprot:scaffold993_cov393-Prasinococcus_capsulatus_cf.AAC.2
MRAPPRAGGRARPRPSCWGPRRVSDAAGASRGAGGGSMGLRSASPGRGVLRAYRTTVGVHRTRGSRRAPPVLHRLLGLLLEADLRQRYVAHRAGRPALFAPACMRPQTPPPAYAVACPSGGCRRAQGERLLLPERTTHRRAPPTA